MRNVTESTKDKGHLGFWGRPLSPNFPLLKFPGNVFLFRTSLSLLCVDQHFYTHKPYMYFVLSVTFPKWARSTLLLPPSGPGSLCCCCTPGPSPPIREFPYLVSGISLFGLLPNMGAPQRRRTIPRGRPFSVREISCNSHEEPRVDMTRCLFK